MLHTEHLQSILKRKIHTYRNQFENNINTKHIIIKG